MELRSCSSRSPDDSVCQLRWSILIWGATGLVGVYALGNVIQAVGMATGLVDSSEQIDAAGLLYLCLFLLAAAGFTEVAISHTRRNELGPGSAVVGTIGGVVLLGVILIAPPLLLTAVGTMPST